MWWEESPGRALQDTGPAAPRGYPPPVDSLGKVQGPRWGQPAGEMHHDDLVRGESLGPNRAGHTLLFPELTV